MAAAPTWTATTATPCCPAELSDAESTAGNDGALFCSDVIQLADGRIMAVGGTDYYTEPSLGPCSPRDVLGSIDGAPAG